MPPHIKQRLDRGGCYYLVDGDVRQSLGTNKKGLAQYRLEQYIRGEFGLGPQVTLREFYNQWIDGREKELDNDMVRPSLVRDYKQHFSAYILPALGERPFAEITVELLIALRAKLLKGRSQKTVRNIIDSSFRALWSAALSAKAARDNPFEHMDWPRREAPDPDPFTAEEREQIIDWWGKNDPFYYSWVAVVFLTGMRPSEAAALRWSDIDLGGRQILITKSRNLRKDGPPKTKHSKRPVPITDAVMEALRCAPSLEFGTDYVFINKLGEPLQQHNWAHDHWGEALKEMGIRYRKFYATRHTNITEDIKAGKNPLAVAQDHGNSVAMIQESYLGRLSFDRTKIAPGAAKQLELLVVPTGIEPVDLLARMRDQVRHLRDFKRLENRKLA